MTHVVQFLRHKRAHLFSIERLYATVRAHLPQDIVVTTWSCPHPSRGVLPRLIDAWAARRTQGDVNHVTGDAHYLTFFLDSRRTILTVHDTESLDRSTGLRRFVLWLFWYWLPVKRSARIVVISEATRAALHAAVTVDDRKIATLPNPLTGTVRRRTGMPRPGRQTVLHIGTNANKNLDRHVAALRGMDVRLIVLGRLNRAQVERLDASGLDYDNRFDIDDDAMAALYAEADLLLFASTTEGFGLPILEAQAAGIPVVTSNRSSMPEVAGDGAILVDPENISEIRAAVQRICDDPAVVAQLVTRGDANVARFAPDTIAAQYAELYRSVARGAR